MWLYKHHTCSDIIDLDHDTGLWRLVGEDEKPPRPYVLADLPIAGGYTVEDSKYYMSYWTVDQKFVFRVSDGKVFEICQKKPDGTIIEFHPGWHIDIVPSQYSDGRLRQGYSDVRLQDGIGKVLYQLSYNSEYYLKLYGSDLTAASMVQDLSDWDFFVALKGAIEIFHERAESGRIALALDLNGQATIEGRKVSKENLIYADSGNQCERSGVWAVVDDLRGTAALKKGDSMPKHNGRDVMWVWSRDS